MTFSAQVAMTVALPATTVSEVAMMVEALAMMVRVETSFSEHLVQFVCFGRCRLGYAGFVTVMLTLRARVCLLLPVAGMALCVWVL